MKMAPLIESMNRYSGIRHLLVHTGQHYDQKMSKSFFEDLGMPKPDIDLEVGSGTHADQTAKIMIEFEKVCIREKPDIVIVVGDVNSTVACAITAKKLGIKVAHVEAGLRSRDMSMPEEINRLCTDVLADYLFTTDRFANKNLKAEGIPDERIFFVGNVMIDTLLKHRKMAQELDLIDSWGLKPKHYATMTLHRPSNVDDKATLEGILDALRTIAEQVPVIFPIHPRTRKMIESFGLAHCLGNGSGTKTIRCVEPLGYLEFLHLNMHAKMVLTDSGGLQEETTVLGVPCITMRDNTERPVTCEEGTNVIVGSRKENILAAAMKIIDGNAPVGRIPEKWDGKSSERIVEILAGIEKNLN
jgi:UDP-N-acetylglucosamine 2-epimerase (non-hydrolysing)